MNHKLSLRIMAIAAMLALAAMPAWAAGGLGQSGVEITAGQIRISAEAATAGGTLTVHGPDGFKQVHRFAPGQALVAQLLDEGGAVLADGMYRFHLKPDTIDRNSRPQFGVFFIQGGRAVSRAGKRQALAERRGELAGAAAAGSMTPAGSVGSSLQTPGGEGYTASDYINIVDTAMDGYTFLTLYSNSGGASGPTFDVRNNGFAAFIGYPAGLGYYGSYAGVNVVGNVFMGSPGYKLMVNSYSYALPLTVAPYAPSYSLWLASTGIGVGTYVPAADFHLTNLDGAGDTVFKLVNAAEWNLGTTGTGVFTFNKAGSGGQEATFRDRLDAAGATFEVQGSVKATNVVFPSSRELKTGFKPVDPALVLDKVVSLPVTSWRFKTDPEDMIRFGPVAEDFHSAFGVGDGKSLSALDVQGLSLAAIQGLNARLDEQDETLRAKDAQIAELRRVNAVLEERLAAIEARLAEGSP